MRGAFDGGATEVVVMDCHGAGGDWSFNSLIPDALDARCEFVVQTRWTEYTELLEQGCDAALFVGQHARAGAERGVLSHTVSSTSWHDAALQRRRSSARSASTPRCAGPGARPVALVTGDDVVCAEATALLGPEPADARGQDGLGRFSARHLSPARARERLEAAPATRSPARRRPVYDPGAPCTIDGRAHHHRPRRPLPPPRRRDRQGPTHGRGHGGQRGGTPGGRSTCSRKALSDLHT